LVHGTNASRSETVRVGINAGPAVSFFGFLPGLRNYHGHQRSIFWRLRGAAQAPQRTGFGANGGRKPARALVSASLFLHNHHSSGATSL
jgi:hypothetical protein